MALDLLHLSNKLTDKEFAEIIISSGDYFPGFYRFTMGSRTYEKNSLSVSGLISAYFNQVATGKVYDRDTWTSYTKQRHESLDVRNASRSDNAVYDFLDRGYLNWMTKATCYDIAVIETNFTVDKIVKDQTYFFMGSLVRFSDIGLILGFDGLRNEYVLNVPVDINELVKFTQRIYNNNLKDFFLPADIVASLTFQDDLGILHMTNETIERTVSCSENSIVIASNRDVSKHLPIRWAKDIILTEVI